MRFKIGFNSETTQKLYLNMNFLSHILGKEMEECLISMWRGRKAINLVK